MNALAKLLHRLLESYIAIMALSIFAGLFLTGPALLLAPFTTLFLQGIFFFAGLKLDVGEIKTHFRNPGRAVLAALFMLVLFPLIAYPAAKFFIPEAAIGLMLLAAMPTGMTAPLFAALAGGSETLALILTALTSFFAPFTVPLVSKLTVGASVKVDVLGMFVNLVLVIIAPLLLAQVVRVWLKTKVAAATFTFKPISLLLLGLLITAVVAKNSTALAAGLKSSALPTLAALFVFFALTHLLGFLTAFHRSRPEKISYAICLSYMNFVTAIYLAEKYFGDPETVLTTVLSIIPWTLLFVFFRTWALSRRRDKIST